MIAWGLRVGNLSMREALLLRRDDVETFRRQGGLARAFGRRMTGKASEDARATGRWTLNVGASRRQSTRCAYGQDAPAYDAGRQGRTPHPGRYCSTTAAIRSRKRWRENSPARARIALRFHCSPATRSTAARI